MKLNVRGDKVLLTDGIKDYINTKMARIEKYFGDDSNVNANIVVRLKGRDQIIEVTIPTKSFTLRSEEANSDLYAAIDLVTDKIERQIRKNKTRIEKKLRKDSSKDFIYDFIPEIEDEDKNEVVKRKKLDTKPMNEEEAILQMNLLGHSFFIFDNIDTGNISVIYKRKDNNYGIIDVD